jgi:nucleolar protein 15
LDSEQGRLLEEVVTKQEEVDQLMSEMNSLRQSEESLSKELQDLMKINESLQERLKLQGNVSTELQEKELIIVEYESDLEDLRARHEKLRSQLRSSESFREEQGVQLKARDSQIAILEEELGTIRELQVANSSRLSEQLKRLAELEMDAGRKKAAQEAAQLKLEQAETAAQKTIHALEAEITKLQEQLTVAVTDAETLRNADGMNSSRLRQESRLLEEKIEALRASEIEKGHMADEIERLERELEELRRRLAELLGQVSNMKNAPPVAESNPIDEDGKALVYDDAADELHDLKRISLLNLLYSVSFASVRDGRQWKALTLSALSDAVRPLPIKRQRDNLYYAKKRSARVLVHLAQAPVSGRIPRVGWTDADVQTLSETVGWGDAEDVWLWATRALAAISRVFQGPNAHQMYQLSGLQAALDLMRHAESDKQIQLHGARIISGLVSGELAFFAQGGSTNRVWKRFGDARRNASNVPARRQSRPRGGSSGLGVRAPRPVHSANTPLSNIKSTSPSCSPMSCHTDDLKVVESCCGAVLAAACSQPGHSTQTRRRGCPRRRSRHASTRQRS